MKQEWITGSFNDTNTYFAELSEPFDASEFKNLAGIEYFDFEEDFMEQGVRCIPMIVRFKMDAAGIKLKLAEWCRFAVEERIELAKRPCTTNNETRLYNMYLSALVRKYTGTTATSLEIDRSPEWNIPGSIPHRVDERATACGYTIAPAQWEHLTNLERFALLKLSRPGHESKNFVRALKEFGLQKTTTGFAKP